MPFLSAATSHLGWRPRPAQVWVWSAGLRYLASTLTPLRDVLPPISSDNSNPDAAANSAILRLISASSAAWPTPGRDRISYSLQVLDEVMLLRAVKLEVELGIVVIDHVEDRCEPPIVIEAPLLMRPQPCQWRRPVHAGRRPISLERVDADLAGSMQVLPRLGKERRDVAGRALRRSVEDRPAAVECSLVI